MGDTPWTREDWNDIIRRVNNLSENPDPGCQKKEPPLEEVGASHRWSQAGIEEVRQRLIEICKDNQFEDVHPLWRRKTIDQINDAIDKGWCDCCDVRLCPFGDDGIWMNLGWSVDYVDGVYLSNGTFWLKGNYMDYAQAIHALQVGPAGFNSMSWEAYRYETTTGALATTVFGAGRTGTVDCQGRIVATMDSSGTRGMRLASDGTHQLWLKLKCTSTGLAPPYDPPGMQGHKVIRCCETAP